jgi:hypothetical protein
MYSTILLDLDVFVKTYGKNLNRLFEKIQYSTSYHSEKAMLGVILVIPKTIKTQISDKTSENNERILFLNSIEIVDSIVHYSYVLYDDKKRVCEILNYDDNFLENIINAIMTGFTSDTIIWVFAPLHEKLKRYNIFISLGFRNPHFVKTSPLGRQFNQEKLCMTRNNSIFEKKGNRNDLGYVLKNKNADICSMKIRFDHESIIYLKKLPEVGFEFGGNGILTQRELSGKFRLTNEGEYFSVHIDEDNIDSGGETEVTNMTNRYNFHTHPRGAYAIYKVKYGFPSAQDYVSFLRCVKEFDATFHVVVSLEGIYVINIGKDFVHSLNEINQDIYDFIEKNYDAKRDINDTVNKYILSINNIRYSNKQIFEVVFLDWKNISKDISINYNKSDLTCIATDQSQHHYKKLFKN